MIKKLYKCFITGFMMLLVMFLVAASVEAENGPSQGSNSHAYIEMRSGDTSIYIWNGNPSITFVESHKGSVEGVSYNEAANTLTLNNVNLPNTRLQTNEMGDDFKITVTGSNRLGGITVWGYGWGGNVEIIGNGSLELCRNPIQAAGIVMMAEGTEGRIAIGPDVTVTLYKGGKGTIWISGSLRNPAPIDIKGKLAAPLTLSADSGKTKLEGWEYMGFETEPTVYDWLYTNNIISITPAAGTPGTGTPGTKPTPPPSSQPGNDTPAKGDILTSGDSRYQVTEARNTVAYAGTSNQNAKSVTIPATVKIDGITYKVTSINTGALANSKKLTTAKIGSNVASIGADAFSNCPELKSVTIGKNVTSIGNKAFYKCVKMNKITIPAKVNKIGKQAFAGCKKLTDITVKTTVLTGKNVGNKALSGIGSKAKINVPKKKLAAYKKLLKSKGIGKKVKVTGV